MFRALGFERDILNGVHRVETAVALVLGDVTAGVPLVRIHSQCFTGEMLGSLRCDCRDQLEMAMQAIADEGRGLLIYEHQEGRGIGLSAKLQAYALQDSGLDTVEANHALGFMADCRDFSLPAAILHDLGLSRIRLLSNNSHKTRALVDSGIEVVDSDEVTGRGTEESAIWSHVIDGLGAKFYADDDRLRAAGAYAEYRQSILERQTLCMRTIVGTRLL